MNNSNKTLLQILVEELPKRGGWPSYHRLLGAVQDFDREVKFNIDGFVLEFELNSKGIWGSDRRNAWLVDYKFTASNLAIDYATAIITSDQYEAALAASQAPAADADGWIEWHGGECPVDSDEIVEVKFREPCKIHFSNDRAGEFTWIHYGHTADIIAYRLVNKHELETSCIDVKRDAVKSNDAQLEADLNDCIGQTQSNDDERDEILYELANFAATTKTSLDIGVATEIAIWLSGKGYRKQ